MLLIIIGYFFIISFGLGLDHIVLASASKLWSRLTSLMSKQGHLTRRYFLKTVYWRSFCGFCYFEKIGGTERTDGHTVGRGATDVVLSPLLLLKSGIIYLPPLKYLHHLTPFNVTSKHTVLPHHLPTPPHL